MSDLQHDMTSSISDTPNTSSDDIEAETSKATDTSQQKDTTEDNDTSSQTDSSERNQKKNIVSENLSSDTNDYVDPSKLSFTFTRQSETAIALSFRISSDLITEESPIHYQITRKSSDGSSETVIAEEEIPSTDILTEYTIVDEIGRHEETGYLYRLTLTAETLNQIDSVYSEIPASTLLVCVDPGHTYGVNVMSEGEHWYCEGEFTLQVSEALIDVLHNDYGITAYSTRDPELNGSLDTLIYPRGEYAAGSDLFFSIHTNANNDNANGYPTQDQPIGITKTIVIANDVTRNSVIGMSIANSVGQNVSEVNYSMGLSETPDFDSVTGPDCIEWTDTYNDSLNTKGTVVQRTDAGEDYYGVLLGSSDVGVKGMIVEHSFHTVDAMREAAGNRDLAEAYARADAAGIAEGFGISVQSKATQISD